MRVRVRLADVTLRRIGEAALRRARAIPDVVAWYGPSGRNARERLARFRDLHRGERAFVLGNGPSLARTDLARIAGAVTFGANRIYLAHQPTYFTCVNELVLEQFAGEIRALACPKFLNWNRRQLFGDDPFVSLALGLSDRFVPDPTQQLCSGGTVTFVALQLAYYMGFREVVLLGVDHRFVDRGTPNRTETRTQTVDANHFHASYFPQGSKWQLPDLRRSELAYESARRAFERDGRRIVDATIDGACRVFERAAFEDVVK
jgi:hypothetical protein